MSKPDNDFLFREVSFTEQVSDGPLITANRYRNSKGSVGISVFIGEGGARQELRVSGDTHGDLYEQVARAVAAVLERAASDPCMLP